MQSETHGHGMENTWAFSVFVFEKIMLTFVR